MILTYQSGENHSNFYLKATKEKKLFCLNNIQFCQIEGLRSAAEFSSCQSKLNLEKLEEMEPVQVWILIQFKKYFISGGSLGIQNNMIQQP